MSLRQHYLWLYFAKKEAKNYTKCEVIGAVSIITMKTFGPMGGGGNNKRAQKCFVDDTGFLCSDL
jgi:hypothetical protein